MSGKTIQSHGIRHKSTFIGGKRRISKSGSHLKKESDAGKLSSSQPNKHKKSGGKIKKEAHHWASFCIWSGRRGSNSRPIPWQGIALPTELLPQGDVASDSYDEPSSGLTRIFRFRFCKKQRREIIYTLHFSDKHHKIESFFEPQNKLRLLFQAISRQVRRAL